MSRRSATADELRFLILEAHETFWQRRPASDQFVRLRQILDEVMDQSKLQIDRDLASDVLDSLIRDEELLEARADPHADDKTPVSRITPTGRAEVTSRKRDMRDMRHLRIAIATLIIAIATLIFAALAAFLPIIL